MRVGCALLLRTVEERGVVELVAYVLERAVARCALGMVLHRSHVGSSGIEATDVRRMQVDWEVLRVNRTVAVVDARHSVLLRMNNVSESALRSLPRGQCVKIDGNVVGVAVLHQVSQLRGCPHLVDPPQTNP